MRTVDRWGLTAKAVTNLPPAFGGLVDDPLLLSSCSALRCSIHCSISSARQRNSLALTRTAAGSLPCLCQRVIVWARYVAQRGQVSRRNQLQLLRCHISYCLYVLAAAQGGILPACNGSRRLLCFGVYPQPLPGRSLRRRQPMYCRR